jgi:hypothetical protein
LFQLLTEAARITAMYRAARQRSDPNTDLDALTGFCDWAEAAIAEGRVALAMAEQGEFIYCPPHAFSDASLASRIRARHALTMQPPRPDATHRPRPGRPH